MRKDKDKVGFEMRKRNVKVKTREARKRRRRLNEVSGPEPGTQKASEFASGSCIRCEATICLPHRSGTPSLEGFGVTRGHYIWAPPYLFGSCLNQRAVLDDVIPLYVRHR